MHLQLSPTIHMNMQRNLLPLYQFPSMNSMKVPKTHIVRIVNNVNTVRNTILDNVHDIK